MQVVEPRFAVFMLEGSGKFLTNENYEIFINGTKTGVSNKVVETLYDLLPQTAYSLDIVMGEQYYHTEFTTGVELVTLDVHRFGAKGDGKTDDTSAIQAAILCCPANGRVLVPQGDYRVGSLFLKSDITIEVAKDATLKFTTDRKKLPILPGLIETTDGKGEYNLGSWEGNPLNTFASLFTGVGVENVVITGQGVLDGEASFENWWKDEGRIKIGGAFRPRMIFLNNCKHILIQGLTIQNSPAWNLHPYFSEDTKWINLTVLNPKVSPNTDGIDPESVNGLLLLGVHFSLGDDCIAIKAGKIYMGKKYKVPSRNLEVRHCLMENGHGAVTIGSEMAGGVYDVLASDCVFRNTDRGLRVKTRRGRGKDAVVSNITFENIDMDGVLTPFVVNSFYWCCDPDGHSDYVRSKECLPVDDRTPRIKELTFRNIDARNSEVAACYFHGLPEAKIEKLTLQNVHVGFAEEAKPEYPAMMADLDMCIKKGYVIKNVNELVLDTVTIEGQEGLGFLCEDIDILHTQGEMECDLQ
ncbi:MAG TPA: polygalacturonase [Sphaerochaeta sp.]|nr:polygalacturonase [Sphaerochaeta sp.]